MAHATALPLPSRRHLLLLPEQVVRWGRCKVTRWGQVGRVSRRAGGMWTGGDGPGSGLLEQLLREVPQADVGVLGHRAEPGVRGSGDQVAM